MDKSRRIKLSQLLNTIETQNMKDIGARTGNVYESLAIISKRANQIHADLKQELHAKLEDFASHSDSLEEIHENREQIEISRFYERLPHPTVISTNEFLESGLEARYND